MSDQYKFNNDPKNIPVTDSLWRSPIPTQPNIDLRDHFAGLAMQAVMTAGYWNWHEPEKDSARCYAMADAMIKAREAK